MATSMIRHMTSALGELRYQPTQKHVRVQRAGTVIADTTRPLLIWEPTRVVPSYAVPEADIRVLLDPAPGGPPPEYRPIGFGPDMPSVLDPSIPFAVHTADGEALTVNTATASRPGDAFRLTDPDLGGYVVLDFDAFDWFEEDEPIVSHPRDPFHRIDVRRSSRRVRVEHGGLVLAETTRPHLLFEGAFPIVRYYLPRDNVRVELRVGSLRTACAYKGWATHHDAVAGDDVLPNIAWSYEEPLDDATQVKGLVCFYQERLDLFVDGEPHERPDDAVDMSAGRPLAIVDIDGVVADVRHRLHHIERRPKDWDAFFAAAPDDPPHAEGVAVAQRLAEDHDIVFLTGRPGWLRAATEAWLEANGIGGHQVVMRPRNDRRPAAQVKLELVRQLSAGRQLDVIVDDDEAVVSALQDAGYPVFAADWERRNLEEEATLLDAQEVAGET